MIESIYLVTDCVCIRHIDVWQEVALPLLERKANRLIAVRTQQAGKKFCVCPVMNSANEKTS